tara:strand:- start:2787 stop:3641 length:855 start_codon:yes stop_codon:yes gene_type:complete
VIDIGQMNELIVHEESDKYFILRAPDFDVDVYLAKAETSEHFERGHKLEVFVYVDNQDRPQASLSRPEAVVGEYAVMQARETHQFGAFMNWGISKDLLVPDTEQKDPVGEGKFYIVRVCLDERTNKVYGTTKVGRYIKDQKLDIKEGDQVSIIPAAPEELGYRSLINRKFIGIIYHNEIFQKIKLGEELSGVVKKLRPDGLVDAALQVQGIKNVVNSQDQILDYLSKRGGKSKLNDKSDPMEIRRELNMSKKTFKSALGMLYKKRSILIHKDGIELASHDQEDI